MRVWLVALAALGGGVTACRPSDVLSVPPPAGVTASGGLASQAGAEGAFTNAKFQLFTGLAGDYQSGVITWSGLLTDEFTFSGFRILPSSATVDAREVAKGSSYADMAWQALLNGRSVILLALPGLVQYEPASGQSKVGEAYALVGYAELTLAENFCAGTPLDEVVPGGGIRYGMPLTSDSLLGVAEGHFDSALAHASGDTTVVGLASVGLGRVLLDRGQYAAAGTAVANVPAGFVYNTELAPGYGTDGIFMSNLYASAATYPFGNFRFFNVADQDGVNGLNYLSALDPRLTFDSSMMTSDGGTWYLPTKFEVNFAYLPLATGVEAALIGAEAALQRGDAGGWLADLNTLRNSGCTGAADSTCALGTGQVPAQTTGLLSLADPGSDSARMSLLFRERAFWLFGTGTRLEDLRRLIRQYGRDEGTIFPTGPYPNGNNRRLPAPIPNYGTDVELALPTRATGQIITNPNYKGCLTPTTTA